MRESKDYFMLFQTLLKLVKIETLNELIFENWKPLLIISWEKPNPIQIKKTINKY